jgi:hypothetical protein
MISNEQVVIWRYLYNSKKIILKYNSFKQKQFQMKKWDLQLVYLGPLSQLLIF